MHFSASLACLALLHQAVGVPVPVLAPTGGIPPAAPPAANMNGPGVISDVPPPIPVQGQIKSSNGLPTAPNPNAVATTGKSNALATAPKPNIGPTAPNPNVMGVNPGLTPGMGDDEYGDDEYGDDDLDPGYDDPMNPSNGLPTGGSSGPKLPDYGNTQLAGPTGTKPPVGLTDPLNNPKLPTGSTGSTGPTGLGPKGSTAATGSTAPTGTKPLVGLADPLEYPQVPKGQVRGPREH
ncbi:hypothetical protein MCOR07_004744 [Pyricularia oryzae]|nr:hypothetical protein MCOR01_000378 [Pyricularia oryzae]KAI6262048.1 hypothetical protein MCOR19_001715 [Pyricularia oryzae]KAI6282869.1 hypothetical protein MCOR26_002622 [Pyricularia oryzae]KAI6330377.1 hypothetical protein MCOR29_001930 [Pyricularia oryzae]KAI6341079.1 hypothetical protein MCOR30_002301 [Pyricularia oryzae]